MSIDRTDISSAEKMKYEVKISGRRTLNAEPVGVEIHGTLDNQDGASFQECLEKLVEHSFEEAEMDYPDSIILVLRVSAPPR